jgi:hypothetical protein
VSELITAAIAFLCMCAGIALGFGLRAALKETVHDAKEILGNGDSGVAGLVVLLSALVLGLLVASATSTFKDVSTDVAENAAKVSLADQMLKDYGPEADPARRGLCDAFAGRLDELKSGSKTVVPKLPAVARQIHALSPQNPEQTAIQTRVENLIDDVRLARRNVFVESDPQVPSLLIGVLVFWLSAVFTAFALQAPRSGLAVCTLLVGALSAAAAIYLVEDLNSPLDGLIVISTNPLERTFATMCT